jgi:hypothetical protein
MLANPYSEEDTCTNVFSPLIILNLTSNEESSNMLSAFFSRTNVCIASPGVVLAKRSNSRVTLSPGFIALFSIWVGLLKLSQTPFIAKPESFPSAVDIYIVVYIC